MRIIHNDYSCPDFNPISPNDPCYICPDFAECDGCTCRFDCTPISPNMDYSADVTGNGVQHSEGAPGGVLIC